MSINTLTNGCGVAFSVINENEIINFKLAVFTRNRLFHSQERDYVYGFVSDMTDDGKRYYSSGTYSGGTTGMGISDWDMRNILKGIPDDLTLVTTNLEEIKKLAELDEERVKKEKEEYDRQQQEKVGRINNLPKKFGTNNEILDKFFYFERSEAEYNKTYSKNILGGNISICRKGSSNKFDIERFISSDGKFLIKSFKDWESYSLKDLFQEMEAKEILVHLKKEKDDLQKYVKNI